MNTPKTRSSSKPKSMLSASPDNLGSKRQATDVSTSSSFENKTNVSISYANVVENAPSQVLIPELLDYKFTDVSLTSMFSKMKGYFSPSSLQNQVNMRDCHSLIKNTFNSFGFPGLDVKKLAEVLKIKVSEDQGDIIKAKDNLVSAFTDHMRSLNWAAQNDKEKKAADQLSSLVSNLVSYSHLPDYINGNDYAYLFIHYHYVRHVQNIFFQSSISSYNSQLRIGSDHKNDLANVLAEFNHINASSTFLDLIEKIIEKIVRNIFKDFSNESKSEFLRAHQSHFLATPKAYEKGLPKVQKVKLSESAKKRMSRNSRYRVNDNDKIKTLVTTRPTLETKGFLSPDEKVELIKFNSKLNEVSRFVPDLEIPDGSVRRGVISGLVRELLQRSAAVNATIRRRKNRVHGLLVQSRNAIMSADDEKHHQADLRKPFSAQEWRDAFDTMSKTDLTSVLEHNFTTRSADTLVMGDFIPSLMKMQSLEIDNRPTSLSREEDTELLIYEQ